MNKKQQERTIEILWNNLIGGNQGTIEDLKDHFAAHNQLLAAHNQLRQGAEDFAAMLGRMGEQRMQHTLTLVENLGDAATYTCSCGERFRSSPCGEENVMMDLFTGTLISACPKRIQEITEAVKRFTQAIESYRTHQRELDESEDETPATS